MYSLWSLGRTKVCFSSRYPDEVSALALLTIRRRAAGCPVARASQQTSELFERLPMDKDGHECCHGSPLKPGRDLCDRSSNPLAGHLSIQLVPQLFNERVIYIVHHGVDVPLDVDKNACTASAR